MESLKNIIDDSKISEIFFGNHGFEIVKSSLIDEMQLGYSIHPDGSDLCGTNEGDWFREWVVIGSDTEVGDPFFVNTNNQDLPVYTAMHGVGTWEPELVSKSLNSFFEALKYLKSLTNQTYSLIDPNDDTITDDEKLNNIQKKITQICGTDEYWESFFEQYTDWVEEFGS